MERLSQLLDELEQKIPFANKTATAVSSVSVGWHIDHCLLVIHQIVQAMEASNPSTYQYQFNLKRFIAFTFKRFPRGVAKAPKQVRPVENFDEQQTQLALATARSSLTRFKALSKNHYFLHPFFGQLNRKGAEQMLTIHTAHHLLIIKDILQQQD